MTTPELGANLSMLSPLPRDPGRDHSLWIALLITLMIAIPSFGMVAMGYWNFQERSYLHQAQLVFSKLTVAEKYLEQGNLVACIEELRDVPDSLLHERTNAVAEQCHRGIAEQWMKEAQVYAANSNRRKAIKTLLQISGGPLYGEAQLKIEQWSQEIFTDAAKKYYQPADYLAASVEMLRAIPPKSPLFLNAQQTIAGWQTEWSDNQYHFQLAKTALNEKDTAKASEALKAISNHPFWQPYRDQMRHDVGVAEADMEKVLQEAANFMDEQQLQNAMQKLYELPDVSPWREKKQDLLKSYQANSKKPPVLLFTVLVSVFVVMLTPQGQQIASVFASILGILNK